MEWGRYQKTEINDECVWADLRLYANMWSVPSESEKFFHFHTEREKILNISCIHRVPFSYIYTCWELSYLKGSMWRSLWVASTSRKRLCILCTKGMWPCRSKNILGECLRREREQYKKFPSNSFRSVQGGSFDSFQFSSTAVSRTHIQIVLKKPLSSNNVNSICSFFFYFSILYMIHWIHQQNSSNISCNAPSAPLFTWPQRQKQLCESMEHGQKPTKQHWYWWVHTNSKSELNCVSSEMHPSFRITK